MLIGEENVSFLVIFFSPAFLSAILVLRYQSKEECRCVGRNFEVMQWETVLVRQKSLLAETSLVRAKCHWEANK